MGSAYYMLGTILGVVHVLTKKNPEILCTEAQRILLYILWFFLRNTA